MVAKCSACTKYAAATDGVTCPSCKRHYHRVCVGMPENLQVHSSWLCPECKPKPLAKNDSTPARSAAPYIVDKSMSGCLDTTSPDITTGPRKESESKVVVEIRQFRNDMQKFREETLEGFRSMRQEVQELRGMLSACDARMEQLEERVSVLEQKVAAGGDGSGDQVVKRLEATISQLKIDMNEREQDSLRTDLELSGIPEEGGESVVHLVTTCAAKLGVTLDERDIVSCARVGTTRAANSDGTSAAARPRIIAVRLARRSCRDQLIHAARVRRGTTTEGLGLRAEPRPFYVNERLTKTNRVLFGKAREAGGRLGWRFVWSRDGRIYARQDQNTSANRIRSEEDLERIFGVLRG